MRLANKRPWQSYLPRFLSRSWIPRGMYCDGCLYSTLDLEMAEQEGTFQGAGYCYYLRQSDQDIVATCAWQRWNPETEEFEEDFSPPDDLKRTAASLLWDGCKECGINEYFDEIDIPWGEVKQDEERE